MENNSLRRIVSTALWTDRKVVEEFTPEDKYFWLYLLTNPDTTQLGIYPFVIRTAAHRLGYSSDTVRVLLSRFENIYGVIRYSKMENGKEGVIPVKVEDLPGIEMGVDLAIPGSDRTGFIKHPCEGCPTPVIGCAECSFF